MGKCKNNCGRDAVGRSAYCGASCKTMFNRNKSGAKSVTDVTESVPVTESVTPTVLTMHERQCAANNQTGPKSDQHTINTGKPKSFDELDKSEHNRVSLPGGNDYDGVVTDDMINRSGPSKQLTLAETARVFGNPDGFGALA